jgi:hypothetical protein
MKKEISAIETEIAIAMFDTDSVGNLNLAIHKLSALISLNAMARAYRIEGLPEEKIILPIIRKKIAFIKAAETKKQVAEILELPKVHTFGGEIRAVGPYAIPEEELVMWFRTGLRAPLTTLGNKRLLKLFREVFPELYEALEI